jgi:phosphoribosyl-AMP cyclohydrolase / phosphoribosyl-ATP pyrophosphohydrolase
MIVPSIDLIKGKLVQLKQGKEKVIELNNPIKYAKKYSKMFQIQIIDLDAALESGNNMELIKKICKIAKCRVGGGIRTIEKAKEIINYGAEKIIIGTKANKEFLSELIKIIGKEKIIVALDSKNGKVAINGWRETIDLNIIDTAIDLENYCSEFLYTCIDKEGLMNGIDLETINKLKLITKNKITLAGGISTIQEIKELDKLNIDCIVGMAIYTGKLNPQETFIELLDFKKMNGLIPTIIKDKKGNILTLAYSTNESLKKAIETGEGWYYSRSKNKLWKKGETSGNTQELIEIKTDCDKDSLIFIVKQKGDACHLNQYSCFGEIKKFDLEELYEVICNRIKSNDEKSYTKKLISNLNELKRKIIEEAGEVITADSRENLIWECSDLLYFLFVIMAKEKITIKDIEKENERRNKETLLNNLELNKSKEGNK